jgi:hypothetical protein
MISVIIHAYASRFGAGRHPITLMMNRIIMSAVRKDDKRMVDNTGTSFVRQRLQEMVFCRPYEIGAGSAVLLEEAVSLLA